MSGKRPILSMLMTTAGLTFWISAPTAGSKRTFQTSPLLGLAINSPDGRYMVGHSADALRLMLLDLTTHKAVELANAAAFDEGWPEW